MIENLQDNTYTCYNSKYEVFLSPYQVEVLEGLLSGSISRKKLSELRGNTRRYGNLEKSISLAIINEIYKHEVKNGEKREESG